ncbi:MAG TPA: hypothetical protein VFK94_02990 [Patescibacteria group bacterium]|nr:hypothetical protein [Patescibacteria group bacterium]
MIKASCSNLTSEAKSAIFQSLAGDQNTSPLGKRTFQKIKEKEEE